MDPLARLIGRETDIGELARQLYRFAGERRPAVVGALHITCSDESERECVEAFQAEFAQYLLPPLKFGERSTFRIANLGGRYEWGAIGIALDHYSGAAAREGFQLMLVKINAHVCAEPAGSGLRFGSMCRYDSESVYCGALHALLDGTALPFVDDLQEAMACEGFDRVQTLRDDERVNPEYRSLFVALCSARLQARRAMIEIQDARPSMPVLFLVLPCVTLNRSRKDTEILCGIYSADWREERPRFEYRGLEDDPSAYQVSWKYGALHVEDGGSSVAREARDHRRLVLEQWREREAAGPDGPAGNDPGKAGARQELARIVSEVETGKHHGAGYAKPMLKGLLSVLALLDPVAAALVLFGQGVAGIHHLHRMHRLCRNVSEHELARSVLADIHQRIDGLPAGRAREVIELLIAERRLGS